MQLRSSTNSKSKSPSHVQPPAKTDIPLPGTKTVVEVSPTGRPRAYEDNKEKESSTPNPFMEIVQIVEGIKDPKTREQFLNVTGCAQKTPPRTEEQKQKVRKIHARLIKELAQSHPNLVDAEFLNVTAQNAPSVMPCLQDIFKPPTTNNQGGS